MQKFPPPQLERNDFVSADGSTKLSIIIIIVYSTMKYEGNFRCR